MHAADLAKHAAARQAVGAADDRNRIRRDAGILRSQGDGIGGGIEPGVYIHPVARSQFVRIDQGMERQHRRPRTDAQVGIAADRRAIHIAHCRRIVHVERIGPIPVIEIRRRRAGNRRAGAIQGHFPHGIQRRRIVGGSVFIEIGAIGGGLVGRQDFPAEPVVARQPEGHGAGGIIRASGPAQPGPGGRIQRAAIHETQGLQPRVGPRLAGLGGVAIGADIQAEAVGAGFACIAGQRIAQIDGRRMDHIVGHEHGRVGIEAAHHALDVEIIGGCGGIGEQRVGIEAVLPAQACVLESGEGRIGQAHARVPNQVVIPGHVLTAEQRRRVAQDAVGHRHAVGRREDQRRAVPHHAVHPLVRNRGAAVERTHVVVGQHTFVEGIPRAALQLDAGLVVRRAHPLQQNIGRSDSIHADGAAGQAQVVEFHKTGGVEFQGVGRGAAPVEHRPARAADDADRPTAESGIIGGNRLGLVGGVVAGIDVHGVAAFQVVGIQNRLQAPLGGIGIHTAVGIAAQGRTVSVAGRTVIVHIEIEHRVGRGAHAERPGIGGNGRRIRRADHPPIDGRMINCRHPGI